MDFVRHTVDVSNYFDKFCNPRGNELISLCLESNMDSIMGFIVPGVLICNRSDGASIPDPSVPNRQAFEKLKDGWLQSFSGVSDHCCVYASLCCQFEPRVVESPKVKKVYEV